MKPQAANEIIQCLPRGKTPFRYFPDRYALMLLEQFVGQGKQIREIKKSPYSRLLGREPVKDLVASSGDGVLTGDMLAARWPREHECYLLTLGTWGPKSTKQWSTYYQTTRRGINLVLQLNFSSKHNDPYYELIRPLERHPFQHSCHPIARKGYHTLAWARLDVELMRGEALIEEIQSDWVRDARAFAESAEEVLREMEAGHIRERRRFRGTQCDPKSMVRYVRDVLRPHLRMWSEAMMSAAIWFLYEELGIRRIFYHTFESGNELKGLTWSQPPRSLYTSLPKKFCFQKTEEMPSFPQTGDSRRVRAIAKKQDLRFFLLEL